MKDTKHTKEKRLHDILFITTLLFFFIFFSLTLTVALYERQFVNRVYPGVKVDGISFSAQKKAEVENYFEAKNARFKAATFSFTFEGNTATVSATQLGLGYNSKLIADQAFGIGKSGNVFADTYNKIQAWAGNIDLPPSYWINDDLLKTTFKPMMRDLEKAPINAVFEIKNDRVTNFRPSENGQSINFTKVHDEILQKIPQIISGKQYYFEIPLSIVAVKPDVTLADTNTLGITEHIASGNSSFGHSIPNRIFNVALAASRVDGKIVAPNEVFSFNDTVGDISKLTGYKEAYIIQNGKTILGDGGGVCQVSTTLFRAALNAGLPIVERHAHAYRVGYYEQDSPPGIDATVYSPSYDFKFKNDTGNSILIQAFADTENLTLRFDFYGTSDGRIATITKPIITKETPAPEDVYQDDPTLPKGQVKQVDFKAAGAFVTFSRTVKKGDEIILADKFDSNYRPWQAIYLRGTKEN